MVELRVAPHVVERLLNHKFGSIANRTDGVVSAVAEVYKRWAYLPEMREAMFPQDDGRERPSKETLLARKVARDADGRIAAVDYAKDQQATLARTATLKALRLARDAMPVVTEKKSKQAVKTPRIRSSAG